MHLALKAYQELITTINEMDHSKDESVRESSKVIKSELYGVLMTPNLLCLFLNIV